MTASPKLRETAAPMVSAWTPLVAFSISMLGVARINPKSKLWLLAPEYGTSDEETDIFASFPLNTASLSLLFGLLPSPVFALVRILFPKLTCLFAPFTFGICMI